MLGYVLKKNSINQNGNKNCFMRSQNRAEEVDSNDCIWFFLFLIVPVNLNKKWKKLNINHFSKSSNMWGA